jgi:hypothetical protein
MCREFRTRLASLEGSPVPARLWLIPGMGHDLPPALFGELADAVVALAAQALADK